MRKEKSADHERIIRNLLDRLLEGLLPNRAQVERVLTAMGADVEVCVKGMVHRQTAFPGSYHGTLAHR
jgi:hypothetical protein